jgi:hypothetical protein
MPVRSEILIDHSTARRRLSDLVAIGSFAALVLLPGWFSMEGAPERAEEAAQRERRRAEPRPSAPRSLAELGAFPRAFDRWFEDGIGGRDDLIRLGARAKYKLFRSALRSRWRFGGDDWLFATDHDALPKVLGLEPLRWERLEQWRVTLEERRDWLAGRGIEYALVVVPYKGAVYPDRLPNGLRPAGRDHRSELLGHLAEHSTVRTIDVLPALLGAAASDQPQRHTYSPLGVHWTHYGGYAAYRAVLRALPDVFPGVKPCELEELVELGERIQLDSWAHRIYLDGVVEQDEVDLLPPYKAYRGIPSPEGSTRRDAARLGPPHGPRVLVAHDSFGPQITRFLSMHASRADCRWRPYLETHLVEELAPDIVIEIYSELAFSTRRPVRLSGTQPPEAFAEFEASAGKHELLRSAGPRGVAPYDTAILNHLEGSGAWRITSSDRPAFVRIGGRSVARPEDDVMVRLRLSSPEPGSMLVYDGPLPEGIPEIGQTSPLFFPGGASSHLVPLGPRADRDGLWLALPGRTNLVLESVVVASRGDGRDSVLTSSQ